jgi:hypothetical protein
MMNPIEESLDILPDLRNYYAACIRPELEAIRIFYREGKVIFYFHYKPESGMESYEYPVDFMELFSADVSYKENLDRLMNTDSLSFLLAVGDAFILSYLDKAFDEDTDFRIPPFRSELS